MRRSCFSIGNWGAISKLQRPVEEIGEEKLHQAGAEVENLKLYQTGREFPAPFALVPWRHHVEIISKCKSIDEALFYIGKTIEQGMSRAALVNCIKANLYEHQGKILNNFAEYMPFRNYPKLHHWFLHRGI